MRGMSQANLDLGIFQETKFIEGGLHPQVGWVQRRRYRRADPTLWRSRSVLPSVTSICGGGYPSVWDKLRQLPAGDGGVAMVHH